MTETMLWVFESFVGGLCLGAIIIMIIWAFDVKDRIRESNEQVDEAYDSGYIDGYEAGGRFRFRERCQIARRCRELEKQITEIRDEEL